MTASTQGTAEQTLAEEIWRLMTAQGAMFALDAPIRQSLANLADFIAGRDGGDRATAAATIEAALGADERFAREESNGQVFFVTSRQGAYRPRIELDTHSFKQRLMEPDNPLPIDDISVVVSTSRPAITTVEPVFISDYWQIQAGLAPLPAEEQEEIAAEPVAAPVEEPVVAAPPAPAVVEPVVAEQPAAVEPAVVEPAQAVSPAIPAREPVAPTPAPEPVVPKPTPVAPPPAAPAPAPARPAPRAPIERNTVFTLPDGTPVDLRRPVAELLAEHGAAMERILAEKIENDPLRRIATFGRKHYPEASVVSLGKNDLRKIRDYIIERNEPLLDTELIADLYYHNPRQPDYEGFRFSLNYRLHREKDFEFVGVEGAYLWSAKGLPALGGKRVKAAEMGQITGYLVDGHDDSLEDQDIEVIRELGTLSRRLTFFEWEYGVLPLDAALAALLPSPVLPEQKTAVLRFESPQHYTNYLAEVRYPTGTRGGWIQGLEEFFREHLVPGATITIARGSEPNLFTVSYAEAGEQTERLLTLDEKKNKLGFANLTFYANVDQEHLPSQARYGRLKNLKSFPMGERRKAEMILEHVFETMGDAVGTREQPRYTLDLDTLLLAFNVLRPGSRSLLRTLLANGEHFEADESTPGIFYYTPAPRDVAEEPEEEIEEVQPARRRSGRYIEDDE